jgi:hypothetical protein
LLEKKKLNGANFIDWHRNLRIVLRQKKTEYVLTESYPDDLPPSLSAADHRAYEKRCNDAPNVSSLMLATMAPDLQKQYDLATDVRGYVGCLRTKQVLRAIIS